MKSSHPPTLLEGLSDRPRRPISAWTPPLAFAGWLAGIALARLSPFAPIPIPACGLRMLTGIPCPLCGSTRSLIAWSHGHLAAALRFNPLLTLASLALCLWFALWLMDLTAGKSWTATAIRKSKDRRWSGIVITAVLLNWVYLVLFLPP